MSTQSHESALTSILDDLRRIIRLLRTSSRTAERAFGLSVAQLFVLKTLADAPALSIRELARRTCARENTLSAVVASLIAAQLVARVASMQTGRSELMVTARGRALLAKAPIAAQERLIESLEQLPEAERHALASSLRRVVAGMLLDEERPVMFFEEEEPTSSAKHGA